MNMPNRFTDVKRLSDMHPEAFPIGEQNDPARLMFLMSIVIPALNVIDGGRWGLLTKTDQGNRTPCDIVMWRDTREFADCLTGRGAMWEVFPPAPEPWIWTPVEPAPPVVVPPVPPAPGPSPIPIDDLFAVIVKGIDAILANTEATLRLSDKLAEFERNGLRVHF